MSFGRMTAALASATNEFTLAAASFNIDFSLIKVDAPMEFQGLGRELSRNRKADAETGSTHVTARRLGALFEGVLPKTPKLFDAYGLRVSEISQSSDINPKEAEKNAVFASHSGMDGTSIWAAATSGSSAIGVHLLACMLARIWTATEATSIWVQIIEGRRQEIAQGFESGAEMRWQTYNAARPELSRKQVAEWDASARAWLRAADQVMTKQQKQLMLIVNNVGLPVNNIDGTYESVKLAWVESLETMEKVVQGMPHNVYSGAVLLALMSWHIYPDMVVISSSVQRIAYDDELVAAGGQITVGLQNSTPDTGGGLKWSLSLAHLRYYGDPTTVERSAGLDSSRVSFKQFAFVVLGSLISGWGTSKNNTNIFLDEIIEIAEVIVLLNDVLSTTKVVSGSPQPKPGNYEHFELKRKRESHSTEHPNLSYDRRYQAAIRHLSSSEGWLGFIAGAAESLLESAGLDRQIALRLVKLGVRSGQDFLTRHQPGPLFGLTSLTTILGLLKDHNERIHLLRKHAQDIGFTEGQAVIRYSLVDGMVAEGKLAMVSQSFGFATVTPTKTSTNGEKASTQRMRWIPQRAWAYTPYQHEPDGKLFSFDHATVELSIDSKYISWNHAPFIFSEVDSEGFIQPITSSDIKSVTDLLSEEQQAPSSEEDSAIIDMTPSDLPNCFKPTTEVAEKTAAEYSGHFEEAIGLDFADGEEEMDCGDTGNESRPIMFRYLGGDPSTAAIYILDHIQSTSQDKQEDPDNSDINRPVEARTVKPEDLKLDNERGEEDSTTPSSTGDYPSEMEIDADTTDEENDSHNKHSEQNHEANLGAKSEKEIRTDGDYDDVSCSERFKPFSKKTTLGISAVASLLKSRRISVQYLAEYFALLCDNTGIWWGFDVNERNFTPNFRERQYSDFFVCLRAIASVSEVYKLLDRATIALEVIQWELCNSKWIPRAYVSTGQRGIDTKFAISPFIGLSLSRRETFACIAMFETGTVDLDPASLDTVLAMSSGDSLFVAAPLLCDPYEQPNSREIRRIAGNVGRAGISMLIPPKDLRIAKGEMSSWNHVTHAEFDGNPEDNFKGTSVHLSFTGYEMPLSRDDHGAQDAEVNYVETVLSVHDHGKWIADIDILSTIADSKFVRAETICKCNSDKSSKRTTGDILGNRYTGKFRLTSIDNWQELLEKPANSVVVRSHGNWLGRLAASAICVRRYGQTLIMPEEVCWRCLGEKIAKKRKQYMLGSDPWPSVFIY